MNEQIKWREVRLTLTPAELKELEALVSKRSLLGVVNGLIDVCNSTWGFLPNSRMMQAAAILETAAVNIKGLK